MTLSEELYHQLNSIPVNWSTKEYSLAMIDIAFEIQRKTCADALNDLMIKSYILNVNEAREAILNARKIYEK